MILEYVPLLAIQRELHRIPRGPGRFKEYLRVILNPEGDDVALAPLVAMNPMGKGHVADRLDALLALDADGIGARAAAEASAALKEVPGSFKASLVVVDDAAGGWTNRAATEYGIRFGVDPGDKRFRIGGILWSSEAPTAESVRRILLAAILRAEDAIRRGPARTLCERMGREGAVLARAGYADFGLDDEDLDYTREVLRPHLDAEDMRTAVECLFGDEAARSLGFTPRGLSPDAGLALALRDARRAAALA